MKEAFIGKTICFDECKIGHQCFGGFLNYDPTCEGEFERMRTALRAKFPGEQISLQAVNGKGLYFTRGDNYQCVVQNEAGEWVKRDKPIYF